MTLVRRLNALDVVVLEDNPQTRRLICTVLRALGVGSVREASEGPTALAAIRCKVPDLVISDWEMKPMGGAEFVRMIRHESSGDAARVPIIVLSAHASAAVIREALDVGANQFLAKPIVPGKLLERIERTLNDRRQLVLKDSHYNFVPTDAADTRDEGHIPVTAPAAAPAARRDSPAKGKEDTWEID